MRPLPIKPRLLADGPHGELDLLIGGLGYEQRSREIPAVYRASGVRTVLLDLSSKGEGSYDENRELALTGGSELLERNPEELSRWFCGLVRELGTEGIEHPRIGIDVSSITRDRIARIVEGMRDLEESHQLSEEKRVTVDFLYTPSAPIDLPGGPERIEVLGPVTPRFAGFAPDPDNPVVAFVGLGVEEDRAIGALEYIEPGKTWAFVPCGEDLTFDEQVEASNSWVWRAVTEQQVVQYRVEDPFSLYINLEQLVASESAGGRPILVPLGPKIFAVCCLIVASIHRRAGVWRVSAGRYGEHHDCRSAGKLVGFGIELGRASQFS